MGLSEYRADLLRCQDEVFRITGSLPRFHRPPMGQLTAASVLGVVALSLLELFVAFLQAYIFVFLTALFIGMSLHPSH